MNISMLKRNVESIIPLLDKNLSLAYQEYIDGALPCGAYRHILSRHALAVDIVNCDIVDEKKAFESASFLTIDLRYYIKNDKPDMEQTLVSWIDFLRDQGMTSTNPIFGHPAFPIAA